MSGHDQDWWRAQMSASLDTVRTVAAAEALEGLLDKIEQVNGSVGFYVSELAIREALNKLRPPATVDDGFPYG
jgi:hypothetical protein